MTDPSTSDTERVTLNVEWSPEGPNRVDYHHNVFGLMRFHVDGDVAKIDPEWSRLEDRSLKDGFDRWVTTGDVIRSVLDLPFIEDVDATDLHECYVDTETERDGGGA